MNFFQKMFGIGQKSSTEGQFYPLMNTNYNVKELSKNDYIRLYTGRAYVAVSTISDALADLDFIVTRKKDGEDNIDHEYKDLITYEIIQNIVAFTQLCGVCYVRKIMAGNKIIGLEVLRSDSVYIEELPSSVRYRYDDGLGRQYTFTPDELIIFNNFSPTNTMGRIKTGASPMQAVAMQMEIDVTTSRWNWNFFKNGGSIRDVLMTDQKIDNEAKERVVQKWKDNYGGVNNSHKTALLDQGLKYSNVSVNKQELDFVESRRFTRDEVLAIFKVPQALIGITENSNRAMGMVAKATFAEYCLSPIAKMIEDKFNATLFQGVGFLKFVNVIPADVEQLERDLNNGAITINEYRAARGYKPISGGDTLKNSGGVVVDVPKKSKDLWLEKTITSIIEGSTISDATKSARDSYGEKVRNTKIARTNKYEGQYQEEIRKIRYEQEKDIITNILNTPGKQVKKGFRQTTKYLTMWLSLLGPLQSDVIRNEAQEALSLVGIEEVFQVGSTHLQQRMRSNIKKFALEIDLHTKEKVFDIIDKGNEEGKSAVEIGKNVSAMFQEFTRERSLTIARTEITRASNYATEYAWANSGVEVNKERYTAKDERVCENCGPMNGRVLKLGENFVDKGGTAPGGLKIDYEDIKHPALHVNCRCTILPVLM